jgi:hypothetical protein
VINIGWYASLIHWISRNKKQIYGLIREKLDAQQFMDFGFGKNRFGLWV